MVGGETEPNSGGRLPLISEKTQGRLIEELGLDIDPQTKRIITKITGEKQVSTRSLIEDRAMSVFMDVVEVNRPLAETLRRGVSEGLFLGSFVDKRNACLAGMAIILRAFDIETSHDLIPRLEKIAGDDLPVVQNIITNGLGGGKKIDLLEKLLIAPQIPEIQINLRRLVNEIVPEMSPEGNEFKSGAAAMYVVLAQFLPRSDLQKQS